MIVEESPARKALPGASPPDPEVVPIVVSGRSEAGLSAQALRWADWLAGRAGASLADAARTAALHRSAHDQRAVVVARTTAEAAE